MPACRTPTTSAWKLLAVLRGDAPEALLDSYDAERAAAADENILASTRSTDFITPEERRRARPIATPCWNWPNSTNSPARWSIPGGCRARPCCTTAG